MRHRFLLRAAHEIDSKSQAKSCSKYEAAEYVVRAGTEFLFINIALASFKFTLLLARTCKISRHLGNLELGTKSYFLSPLTPSLSSLCSEFGRLTQNFSGSGNTWDWSGQCWGIKMGASGESVERNEPEEYCRNESGMSLASGPVP